MARYKTIDTSPRFLAVDLERQLIPGTFVHALNRLIDNELDLSEFDARHSNDSSGAPAWPPAVLLKVVLYAYSLGIVGSRGIERACREQVTFIALTGDRAPHFTTLAAFVSGLAEEIAPLFARILYLCNRQGLIGREMFAIDGVKLPSNAMHDIGQASAYDENENGAKKSAPFFLLPRRRKRGFSTASTSKFRGGARLHRAASSGTTGSATLPIWKLQAASSRHREIRESVSPMISRAIAVS